MSRGRSVALAVAVARAGAGGVCPPSRPARVPVPATDRTRTPRAAAETRIDDPRDPRPGRATGSRSALQQRQIAERPDHGVEAGAAYKIPFGRQVRREQA